MLDDGRCRAALASGNPNRRPMFATLDANGAVWSDGRREAVDTIVLATGYRPNLGYLTGIGALDVTGAPLHRAGVSTTIRGLGYVGLPYQRSHASATVRGVGGDAERIVRRLFADMPARRARTAALGPARHRTLRHGLCCPAPES